MKKRLLSVFLIALVGAIMLVGCKKNVGTPEDNAVQDTDKETPKDAPEEDDNYTFGFSSINSDTPYYDALKKSMETALNEKGCHMVSKDPGVDAKLQNKQLQEMIDEGVDAVFLDPVDREEITPALKALKDAHIPVVNIDSQVEEKDLTNAYVDSDNKNAGYLCGEDLVKQRPNGGRVVILECPKIDSVNERMTGFEEAIANSGFEVLARADVGEKKDTAQAEMTKQLAAHPKIDAVMCGNDQVALGAVAAIEAAGRKDILVYGVDGSPGAKKELTKPGTPLAGTGAQSPIQLGKKAVDVGIEILKDKHHDKETIVDTFFINKDNVDIYGTDGWQ